MLIGTIDDRATLLDDSADRIRGIDIAHASDGRFSSSTIDLLESWDALAQWAATVHFGPQSKTIAVEELQAPIAAPRQIFAMGQNYRDVAAATVTSMPVAPTVFTKYPSSITGPTGTVELPSEAVDWEVELVAVVGTGGRDIAAESAWKHVVGFMVGQDLTDRKVQFAGGGEPQHSLAKSYRGFAPTGPWITSRDEVADPGNLSMTCRRGDQVLQIGRTNNLVADVPRLVQYLSTVVELYPGDLIFTGTPEGVGFGRTPQEYLLPGDDLISSIEGLGVLQHRFIRRES